MDIVGSVPRPKLVATLRKVRRELGMTQRKLAEAIGITQATISRIEADPNVRISPNVAARCEKWLQRTGASRVASTAKEAKERARSSAARARKLHKRAA